MLLNRSSHQRYSIKKGVLRNFAKFTWKYLCQGLFLIKMQVLGLKPATLLKKRLLHKGFPANFAKFLRTPFLQNTSGWLLLTKLHDPNRRKMRLPCFELRWLLNGMNMPWHSVFSFSFFFLFRNNVIREQLGENDFRRCYVFFSGSMILKVLDHSYVQSSLSTTTRQLDNRIWKTPYNWIFYGHRCRASTKAFNLLLYASLSLK